MKEIESFQLPSVGSPSKNSDIKYQKAIKEISKLINLNTAIKNQNNILKNQLQKLQVDYKYLQKRYLQALEELQKSNITQLKDSGLISYRNSNSLGEFIEKVRKNQGIEQILNIKNMQIDSLKETINQLQQTNKQLIKNCLSQKSQMEILSKFKQHEVQDIDQERKNLKVQIEIGKSNLRKTCVELEYYRQQSKFTPAEAMMKQFQYFEKMKKLQDEMKELKIASIEEKIKSEGIVKQLRADNEIHLIKLKQIIESVDQQRIFINKYFPSSNYA